MRTFRVTFADGTVLEERGTNPAAIARRAKRPESTVTRCEEVASNVQRDGIEVKPGQTWRNCDKRMVTPTHRVLEVKDGRALMDGYPKRWVSIHRMYPHSTGWELIQP